MENEVANLTPILEQILKRLDSIENRMQKQDATLEGLFIAPLLSADVIGGDMAATEEDDMRRRHHYIDGDACWTYFHDWCLFTLCR
jgi:hypothetical protein